MLIDVKVPVLAESVAEATLMNWYKQPGETVQRGDSLIDIETDKVTLEIAAPNNGVLIEILREDGADVESDELIARIDTELNVATPTPSEPETKPAPEPEQQTLLVEDIPVEEPKLSPAVRNLLDEHNLDAATISGSGDRLTKDDVLKHLDQNSSPEKPQVKEAEPESPSPEPVIEPVTNIKAPVNNIDTAAQATVATPPRAVSATVKTPPKAAPATVATPLKAAVPATVATPATVVDGNRPEERVAMTRLRRRASERLLSAQHESAILTTFNEVNMRAVMDLRSRYKDEFERTHDIKLGFMSFFTKAVVEALKKFPIVNASVEGEDIIYHGFFDIGMAVSAPRGLVVPIVRDADMLSFAEIEAKIKDFGEKAKASKLTIEDLTGGTFTITNGGVFGSLLSTPIINPPQSAILGMHTIQERPVAENGEVVIRPMMYLALSYDHRIIDGKDAVQYLVTIKKQIEDPSRLLLQL